MQLNGRLRISAKGVAELGVIGNEDVVVVAGSGVLCVVTIRRPYRLSDLGWVSSASDRDTRTADAQLLHPRP